jgi:hypothetical protein
MDTLEVVTLAIHYFPTKTAQMHRRAEVPNSPGRFHSYSGSYCLSCATLHICVSRHQLTESID